MANLKKRREHQLARQSTQASTTPIFFLFAGAVLLVVVGVGLFLAGRPSAPPAAVNSGVTTGGPHLTVDRERIDFGNVPVNKMVRADFQLSNTGDRQLTMNISPVRVVEGC